MNPIVPRRVLPLCAALLAGVAATVVVPRDAMAAKQAKVPVAVGSFSGSQSTKVRSKVMDVLRKSGAYEVTDAEDIKPNSSTSSYANMAQALGANAIIVGVISKRFNLTLTVYGSNGSKVDTLEVKGGGNSAGLIKQLDNELEISIADPIAKAKPGKGGKEAPEEKKKPAPKEEEEPPLEEEGETEPPVDGEAEGESGDGSEGEGEGDGDGEASGGDAETPSEPSESGLRPLELTAGFRGYSRLFKYTDIRKNTDDYRTQLNRYSLPMAPAILVNLRFYPAALFRNDAWSHIGLTGRYEFGIATTTQYAQQTPTGTQTTNLTTGSSSWQIGLRGRLPLGTHEVGVFAEYGTHTFILQGDEVWNPPRPYALVPDSKFTFIRTGIDAQFHFGDVILGGHFAPRFLQSVRDIDLAGVWFPGATGSGVDMGIMGGYSVLSFLSIVGGADALRYGFDFNARPDCPDLGGPLERCVVAGGATDTYISGWIGVMLHLDGSAKAAAAE